MSAVKALRKDVEGGQEMARPTDDLILATLMEIKQDMGGMQSDIRQIKENLASGNDDRKALRDQIDKMAEKTGQLPTQQTVNEMEVRLDGRIEKLEGDVSGVKTDVQNLKLKDLAEIREQLVIHKWLSSNRNKIIAGFVAMGLGAGGSVAMDAIKDAFKVTITTTALAAPAAAATKPSPADDLDATAVKDTFGDTD